MSSTNVMAQANLGRNGEPSHQAVDGALDEAVKEKLDSYADYYDYNARSSCPPCVFFLPAVMTTSGRISGDFLRLLYILSHRQAEKFFAHLGILDPSPEAFKHRRGTAYFYYNRSAIGLACAQAIAMRIDIATHKRPIKPARRAPAPYLLNLPMHAQHV